LDSADLLDRTFSVCDAFEKNPKNSTVNPIHHICIGRKGSTSSFEFLLGFEVSNTMVPEKPPDAQKGTGRVNVNLLVRPSEAAPFRRASFAFLTSACGKSRLQDSVRGMKAYPIRFGSRLLL
jgi:hypothetical protein